ncbi:MAG: 50S ribosomal protein L4 [Gemmatimonadaceae bacterium]|nr:50S ribosomal protein L4 [Gemmatimonadaceae bacterium]
MAETMTLEAASYSEKGKAGSRVTLPAEQFDGIVNMPVMHQAVKAYLANQRQGTASTKTRGLVIGGNAKPWKQKGTGRARQGSTRAPHWVGGGTVFGPTPRKYTQVIPRKIRALARKSALNARAREGMVIVIDTFTDFDKPSTRAMLSLLDSAGVTGRKVLILTDGVKSNVYLSARNLERAHVLPYSDASTYHVLWSDVVLIEGTALGSMEGAPDREGDEAPAAAPRKAKAAKKEKPVKSEKAVKAAKKSAAKEKKKTARKTAGKSGPKKTTAKAKTATKSAPKKSAAKKKKGK